MSPPPEISYPKDLTDHSYRVLSQLVGVVPEAILIGGWGTWVRQQGLMSHDIDLIVSHQSRDAIFEIADEHSQSEHLGVKWRAELDGERDANGALKNTIHVDLYVPYQSTLGLRLRLAVEELLPFVEQVGEWDVLDVDAHAATKLAALVDRPESQPGQKDRVELFAMLADITPDLFAQRLARASKLETNDLISAVREGLEYLKDLKEVRRAERKKLDAVIGATARALSQARAAAIASVSGSEPVVHDVAESASPLPEGSGDKVQCDRLTADGSRCEHRVHPGHRCPSHRSWVAPTMPALRRPSRSK